MKNEVSVLDSREASTAFFAILQGHNSMKELQEYFELSNRTNIYDNYLKPLLNADFIYRVQGVKKPKGKNRTVIYRLKWDKVAKEMVAVIYKENGALDSDLKRLGVLKYVQAFLPFTFKGINKTFPKYRRSLTLKEAFELMFAVFALSCAKFYDDPLKPSLGLVEPNDKFLALRRFFAYNFKIFVMLNLQKAKIGEMSFRELDYSVIPQKPFVESK